HIVTAKKSSPPSGARARDRQKSNSYNRSAASSRSPMRAVARRAALTPPARVLYGTSMKPITLCAALLLVLLAAAAPARAQNKVRINWTAVTGAQSGLFMAKEEKLFEKYGLENVELIHIASSSRGIQAILAGEI